jgi:hypothetical protein
MSKKVDESLFDKEAEIKNQLLFPSAARKKPRSLHDDGEKTSLKPPPRKPRKCHEKASRF